MANFSVFAKEMKRVGKNIERNAADLQRTVAIEVDTAVVMATPVDTSRARSNWQVTLEAPATDTLPEPSSSGEGAQRSISEAKAVAGRHKEGQEIWITNNLDYITDLDNGSSAQAPVGYVKRAIAVASSILSEFTQITSTPRGRR